MDPYAEFSLLGRSMTLSALPHLHVHHG